MIYWMTRNVTITYAIDIFLLLKRPWCYVTLPLSILFQTPLGHVQRLHKRPLRRSGRIYTACYCVLLISKQRRCFPRAFILLVTRSGIEEKLNVCVIESGSLFKAGPMPFLGDILSPRFGADVVVVVVVKVFASFSHARSRSFLLHLTSRFSLSPSPPSTSIRRLVLPIRRPVLLVFSIQELLSLLSLPSLRIISRLACWVFSSSTFSCYFHLVLSLCALFHLRFLCYADISWLCLYLLLLRLTIVFLPPSHIYPLTPSL